MRFLGRQQVELERLSRENLRLANLDALTELPNRRSFFASLDQAAAEAADALAVCIIIEEVARVCASSSLIPAVNKLGSMPVILGGSEEINAIEAIAMVGGLSSNLADPTGVFVLRDEPQSVARNVLGQDVYGDQRMAYVLDLTRPNGLFLARDFLIRDGDTVYVTEAPYVQWQKTLGAITGSAATARTLETLGE